MEPVKDGDSALSPLEIVAAGDWLALVGSCADELCERPAAQRGPLVALIAAVTQIARSLEDELIRFEALHCHWLEHAALEEALAEFERDRVHERLNCARGRCSAVLDRFEATLREWFAEALSEQPAREMLRQLERLQQVDDAVLAVMDDLAATLDRETRRVATLVSEGELDAANALLAELRVRFLPVRGILADAASRAFRVQARLIEPAAAEPGAAPEERLERVARFRRALQAD